MRTRLPRIVALLAAALVVVVGGTFVYLRVLTDDTPARLGVSRDAPGTTSAAGSWASPSTPRPPSS